jgi:hypothetical protein
MQNFPGLLRVNWEILEPVKDRSTRGRRCTLDEGKVA